MFSPLKKTDPDWFIFDWRDRVIRRWERGAIVVADTVRRPAVSVGFLAKCTVAGMSADREPAWPHILGATVADGSVVWTMVKAEGSDIPNITGCTYTITPAGITQAQVAIDASLLRTRVKLDAVNAPVGVYTIVAEATDATGEDYAQSEQVEVVE